VRSRLSPDAFHDVAADARLEERMKLEAAKQCPWKN
jgi:hypothetical protein